jgi:undecaprenyl-diphosphatase
MIGRSTAPTGAAQQAQPGASLPTAGYFGLQMMAGLLVFAAAAWLFGGVAEDVVTGDPLVQRDLAMERWFQLHRAPPLSAILSGVSRLHDWPAVTGITVLLVLYLAWRREWRWATTVILVVPGGMLLNVLLKVAFHRTRPTLSGLAAALHSYSFPSGHVMAATLTYGVAAAYLITRLASWRGKVLTVLAACCLVALVAFSRVYLGVHYVSDVVAAASAGVTWLASSIMAADALWHRRATARRVLSRAA